MRNEQICMKRASKLNQQQERSNQVVNLIESKARTTKASYELDRIKQEQHVL